MAQRKYYLVLVLYGLALFIDTTVGFAQKSEERLTPPLRAKARFIYDAQGKRDPFIPLLDKAAPTNLRTVFVPRVEKIKLPVELTVKGILWNGKEYFAIINDEVIKEGESIDMVKIKTIQQDKIIVEYQKNEFELFLKKE